ncbi:hypothetical protein HY993_01900 [Candidatus Micrarchaeota archaeon]|nr:hypothetical protein [Candidatus Micrarchaeota archaeon]
MRRKYGIKRAQASLDYLVSVAASFGALALLLPAVFFAYSLSQKSVDTVTAADFIETVSFAAKSASALGPNSIVSRQARLSVNASFSYNSTLRECRLTVENKSFSRDCPDVLPRSFDLSAGNYLVKANKGSGAVFVDFNQIG